MSDDRDLAAGDFSSWLAGMQRALRRERDADVPCRGCTACCTSSQFVHIAPDETDTLAHVPAALLFPAPGLPRGHVVLGYDDRGHCPMLTDGECSIYEHRPRTCRTYDCRVFPAAGIAVEAERQPAIARQVQRWEFSHPEPGDRVRHDAVRAAASFLADQPTALADAERPATAAQVAVLAVAIHDIFLERTGEADGVRLVEPDPQVVAATVRARTPSVARSAPSEMTGKMPASFQAASIDDQS